MNEIKTLNEKLAALAEKELKRVSGGGQDSNERLFMSKYLTYLPSKEQLRTEIERQKEIFYMQHPKLQEEKE